MDKEIQEPSQEVNASLNLDPSSNHQVLLPTISKDNEDISQDNLLDNQELCLLEPLSKSGCRKQENQRDLKRATMPTVKKAKALNIDFAQFLPQFLLVLNQQKQKSIIRIGRNYQANVPKRCSYSCLYRPLGHLKIWSAGEVPGSVFKKFKEKFGENRTEEDLCLLLFQYQCDWDQISEYLNECKGELRKFYIQKDRTKS